MCVYGGPKWKMRVSTGRVVNIGEEALWNGKRLMEGKLESSSKGNKRLRGT